MWKIGRKVREGRKRPVKDITVIEARNDSGMGQRGDGGGSSKVVRF